MKAKQRNGDIFILLYCVNQWCGIYQSLGMYREVQHGKQHDIGAWDDKQRLVNYHHVIQVCFKAIFFGVIPSQNIKTFTFPHSRSNC